MKITVKRADLLAALNKVVPAAAKKEIMPILTSLLLKVEKDNVSIAATDLDSTIQVPVVAEISEVGSICIPASKLLEVIKELEAEDVVLETKEDSKMVMASGAKTKFRMAYLNAEEFPLLPFSVSETAEGFTMASDTLKELLGVKYAAVEADSRAFAHSVLFHINGKFKVVATDAHRMAIAEAEPASLTVSGEKKILIQKRGAAVLDRFLENDKTAIVTLLDNHMIVEQGDSKMAIRLVEGSYPDYQAVIPQHTAMITVKNKDLADAINSVSVMTQEGSNKVLLNITENAIKLEANDGSGGYGKAKIECKYTGAEPVEIAFNKKYLLEGIGAFGEDITIGIGNNFQPISINENGAVSVITPMAS